MKIILASLILALSLSSCVTPVVNTYLNPPGVFVGVPVIPVEAGIQLRSPLAVRKARQQYGPELNQLTRSLAASRKPDEVHVGLRAMLRGQ
jgi:hypothetical protein